MAARIRFKVEMTRTARIVGRSGRATYAVLHDEQDVGTVKIVNHSRRGDVWAAFDPSGKEVCQSATRRDAAAALCPAERAAVANT